MNEIDPNKLFDGNKTNDDVLDIAIDVPPTELYEMPGDIGELDEYVIRTQEDVDNLRNKVADFHHSQHWEFYFRGHSEFDFELLPSNIRNTSQVERVVYKEKEVIKRLSNISKRLQWRKFKVNGCNAVLFDLMIARHLGLMCRLLDWTGNIESAVTFAFHNKVPYKNGTLWVLAIRGTSYECCKLSKLRKNKINFVLENKCIAPSNKPNLPEGIRNRIRQSGFFTIPHTDNMADPLDKLLEKYPDKNIHLFKVPLIVDETSDFDFKEYAANFSRILPDMPRKVQRKINMLNIKFYRSIVRGLYPRKKSKENM